MATPSIRRSPWLLVLVSLAMTMTISSVLSKAELASEQEFYASDERSLSGQIDEWDDALDEDYSTEEELSEYGSQEYNMSAYMSPPSPPVYNTPPKPVYMLPPEHAYHLHPIPSHQPAYPTNNYSALVYTAYSPPPPPVQTYQPPPPAYPTSNYTALSQPAYMLPPEQAFQPPSLPPPAYPTSDYTAPAKPVYISPPEQTYQPPPPAYPTNNYTVPAQPAYIPPPVQTYQPPPPKPAYMPPPPPAYPTSNYTAQPKPATYVQPMAPPAKPANYSQAPPLQHYPQPQQLHYKPVQPHYPQHQQPQQHYNQQPAKPQYNPAAQARKYSFAELAPIVSPFGYRSNHWSLHYYRFLDHSVCPKPQNYNIGPSMNDVQAAFAHALRQLGYAQKSPAQGYSYLNMSVPSFAARHQIASYMSNNKNARMDDEGLMVEYVSAYLADRLCMTKWDRQRSLPSLTKLVSASNFPQSHSCSQYYSPKRQQWQMNNCQASKYRTYDGFCNNPWHPYWGKSDVCHIRLLSPDYADGISAPRAAPNQRYSLPNPRHIAQTIHSDQPVDGPYNLMKMQWGQFVNHDISNTALAAYDGLVDCCKMRNARGCWPIIVPPGDNFYGPLNVTCLNFIRSGVCPTCQLGPRQQTNKNTAFLDASHVYGNNHEQAVTLRAFVGGQLKTSTGKNGEQLLPVSTSQEQCWGACYKAGDARVNQHPALTALHVLMVRNHNRHAQALAKRHPNWNDEQVYQEARRLNIAEYQMITYGEYLPIVFGPVLSAYYRLTPSYSGYTQYDPNVDPTTWNEYVTAACRFGHSQIASVFALTNQLTHHDAYNNNKQMYQDSFRLKDWFFKPSLLADGKTQQLLNGLLGAPARNVDPYVAGDVRHYLYKSPKEHFGGDLAATNIWRGRDHGLPGYVHYVDYCFNHKVRGWKDLAMFIPPHVLGQLRRIYKVVENVDLFVGGLAERHFPGADIGPTFACINGIQYHHLKFGDRYFFEHGNQAGSFTPAQLAEIKRSSLARFLCRTGQLQSVPQFAFMQTSNYNPLVNCSHVGDFDYNVF